MKKFFKTIGVCWFVFKIRMFGKYKYGFSDAVLVMGMDVPVDTTVYTYKGGTFIIPSYSSTKG